jgi:hypothetical protein
VPGFLGEFSCNDVNDDNAQVVDLTDEAFDSWTIWAYYTAADDPGDCPGQGLLKDDSTAGVAKPLKLDALVVPHAQAIAGTPVSTSLDRSTRTYTLAYRAAAAPGAQLTTDLTQIFVPARLYPKGYAAAVSGGSVVSSPGAPWLLVRAGADGGDVHVTVTPRDDASTRRPLQTGALPVAAAATPPRVCASRRTVTYRLPPGARLRSVTVDGHHVRAAAQRGRVPVSLAGRTGTVRVRLLARTRSGRRYTRVSTLHLCRRR